MKKRFSSKDRSPLMRTKALAITSTLLIMLMICGQRGVDTDSTSSKMILPAYAVGVSTSTSVSTGTTSTTTSAKTTTTSATTSTTSESTTTTSTSTTEESTTATTTQTTTTSTSTTTSATTTTTLTTTAPMTTTTTVTQNNGLPITNQEYILIANVVSHEAGGNTCNEYEKSCIVAAIMNRVRDSRFPNTIDGVVHQRGQMFNVPYYRVDYAGSGYKAVDNAIYAYFSGKYSYGNINSWWGDGFHNHFYYQ